MTDHHRTTLTNGSIRIEGRLVQADRERDPYVLVPFDIPAGVWAVRLTYSHDPPGDADRPMDGAVLDLGLIGPGSTAMGTSAFRGWSGSERSVVTVGRTQATPGYRAGAVDAGTWHAILGLYAIPPTGCRFWLEVELLDREAPGGGAGLADRTPAAAAKARSTMARVPAAAGAPDVDGRWLACDLHAHSVHSDGVDDLADLATAGRRAGLDVLVATDHNTASHHPFLDAAGAAAGIVLLPGEEVTTYGGHMNAIGATRWIDFRHRSSGDVVAAINSVHEQGGIASINHPRRNTCSWEWGDVPMDLVEVWNGTWSDANEASLAWWYELAGMARSPADRPTPVGGSDCHDASNAARPLGTPTTWIHAAAPARERIVDGLSAGRVALTTSPAEEPPRLRCYRDRIIWDLPPERGRRLVVRSTDGVVVERSLAAGDRGGIPLTAASVPWVPLAAEIRGPYDELLALVPVPTFGG